MAMAIVRMMKAPHTLRTIVTSVSDRPGTSPMPMERINAGTILASREMTWESCSARSVPTGVVRSRCIRPRMRMRLTIQLAIQAPMISAERASTLYSWGYSSSHRMRSLYWDCMAFPDIEWVVTAQRCGHILAKTDDEIRRATGKARVEARAGTEERTEMPGSQDAR